MSRHIKTPTPEAIQAKRRPLGLPHWRPSQRARLRQLLAEGACVAYWNSDAHGRPANSGTHDGWRAHAGLVQEIAGPLVLCGSGALHATTTPHRWKGCRVWVVAMLGEVKRDGDKIGALKREFLGEVLPEEAIFCPSVALVLRSKGADLRGADLTGADLTGANLRGADLTEADLTVANLRGADLTVANLRGADLTGANLRGADLTEADLTEADLTGADLRGADLTGANLTGADLTEADLRVADLTEADLRGANLRRANLRGANLTGADLTEADLRGANLRGANLRGADLTEADLRGANLTGANRPNDAPAGWRAHASGYLEKDK